ncbi:MAG: hypothetical protein KME31_23055 [Tolypothrix carrinoi HA7290-LM1]|nr:hypothetical protein [Tolypothrix carrinoi HA7290-LM1]
MFLFQYSQSYEGDRTSSSSKMNAIASHAAPYPRRVGLYVQSLPSQAKSPKLYSLRRQASFV